MKIFILSLFVVGFILLIIPLIKLLKEVMIILFAMIFKEHDKGAIIFVLMFLGVFLIIIGAILGAIFEPEFMSKPLFE